MSRPFVSSCLLRRALAAACLAAVAPLASGDPTDLAALAAEVRALRSEMEALGAENAALRQQFGVPAPQPAAAPSIPYRLRLIGELRLRYDDIRADHPAFADQHDFGLRLRAGAVATFSDRLELGVRLTNGTGDGDRPGRLSAKKSFALDLAFVRWTPLRDDTTTLGVIAGKMEFPFAASDLVFHGDITPEGIAAQYVRQLGGRHTLHAGAGAFLLDQPQAGPGDPLLGVAQVRIESRWDSDVTTRVGLTALTVTNRSALGSAAVPDGTTGNTRTPAGALVHDYRPWVLDAAVTRPLGGIPVRLAGNFMVNPAADTANHAYDAGIFFGEAARAGTWELSYRYRVLQADAWYEELVHPDFGGYYELAPSGGAAGYRGGTNVGGHVFGGAYALSDHAVLGFNYFALHLLRPSPVGSPSDTHRLQVDTTIRF